MLLMMVLGACANTKQQTNSEEPVKLGSITMGVLPDVDSIPFVIAKEKGYFEEEGLTVELEQFTSAIERDSALQSGNLDGAISDILAAAFAKDNDFDVWITSMTNGSYKLLVNKGEAASDIPEIKGKDVGISKNTIIEYVTDQMMKAEGLTPEDINKVVIPKMPARLEMLQSGKIAGATLPEPLATVAMKDGAKLLASSDQLNVNPGIVLFTGKSINEKEEEIKAMYRAYNKAVAYLISESVDSYVDTLVEKGGFPGAIKGTIIMPKYTEASLPDEKEVVDVIRWLQERELIKNTYKYEELVNDKFMR
jgi:NitT/TauT family transport system substrate-binding protein